MVDANSGEHHLQAVHPEVVSAVAPLRDGLWPTHRSIAIEEEWLRTLEQQLQIPVELYTVGFC